jgi:PAS domain S-box-containing protein
MSSELQESNRTRAPLDFLYDISRELASHLDMESLLEVILQLSIDKVGAQSGSILVLDDRGKLIDGAISWEGEVRIHTQAQLADTFENGLAGWVVNNLEAVLVRNTLEDERWLKKEHESFQDKGKSAVLVPIIEQEQILGVVTLVHSEDDHFDEDDVNLLQAICDQAGLAIENAKLYKEEQGRREFASTLQEIAKSINSSLDPNQVFPLILEQLGRVIGNDSSRIFVYEDELLRLVASNGIVDDEEMEGITIPDDEETLMGQVLYRKRPLVIDDVQEVSGWVMSEDLKRSDEVRAWIGAPLLVRDEAVGLLTVSCSTPFAYGFLEVQVVDAFANQAATAVANAQLFAESQRQIDVTVALADTAREVSASLDLDDVLNRILSQTLKTLDVEAASLAVIDESTGSLEFKSAKGEVADEMVGIRLEKGEGIAGWVVENDEPIVVQDVKTDPRFFSEVDRQIGFVTSAIACVPIRLHDEVIGVLEALNPRRGEFEPAILEILMGIAGMAGTAIQHARLFTETQAARKRYTGLFEDSIDPILISNLEGSLTDANISAQNYLGRDVNSLVNARIEELHSIASKDKMPTIDQMEAGDSHSYEAKLLRMDGSELPVEVYVKRMDVEDQPVLQWIMRDMSERQALDQLRADLTSMIFHDLRSPLGNIISSLEVMKTSMEEEDDLFTPVISVAQRSSRRLSRLIDSLLDISLLEEGKAVLYKTVVLLHPLVKEAVEEVLPTAEAKGHDLSVEDGENIPKLEIDVDMIRRVIINLVENAVKYTPSGGKIVISLEDQGNKVQVGVKDTGSGIGPNDQARIFDKFARVERKGRSKGLGLGLAFCRLAVEAHGGEIWVESEADRGSTFLFTLPV